MVGWILVLLLQDDLAAGQSYLEKVGQSWSAKCPEERVLGVYIGRKSIGNIRFNVKPSGDGFELAIRFEAKYGDTVTRSDTKIQLSRKLELVRAEETGKGSKVTYIAEKGRWKLREETGGKSREKAGEVKAASVWEANFLPLFLLPSGDVSVYAANEFRTVAFHRLEEKRRRKSIEYGCLRVTTEGEAPAIWLFDGDRAFEFKRKGEQVRFRVIAEAGIGKDLDEPLEISEPMKAVISVISAMKRGDKEGVLGGFDVERFTREKVPEYATCSKTRRQEILETTRTFLATEFMSDEARAALPEAALIEDWFAMTLESTEKDGVAEVTEPDGAVWKLGIKEGQWKVYGISGR